MDQRWLRLFMPAAVKFAEDEKGEPLKPRFAQAGQSGMSYGTMQNDIAANQAANDGLRDILIHDSDGDGYPIIPRDRVDEILKAGAQPGISGKQFESRVPGGTRQVQDALARNPDMVNAQDAFNLMDRRSDVASAIGGAARNYNGPGELGENPNPRFIAKLGAWANRTGDLNAATEFLRTTPHVTEAAFDDYLRQTDYFKKSRETVEDWTNRLDRATAAGQRAYDNAPEPPEPQVNLLNSDAVAAMVPPGNEWTAGPVPENLLNANALPENLLNMSDYELLKWGLR